MAYRFLLEVPENLAEEANIAVTDTQDAQVVLVRPSHGLGFDDPYVDLTIAAHTLNVVDSLYNWFNDMGASQPDLRVVLHGGERLQLEALRPEELVARIRRDQPWVERTIPMVGEHERDRFDPPAGLAVQEAPVATATIDRNLSTVPSIQDAEARIEIQAVNHISINVTDLAKAEEFYRDFLSMDVIGRARNVNGGWSSLSPTYTWDDAIRAGEPADLTFLRNGPLVLSVRRRGLGARFERGALNFISLRVDPTTFLNVKGDALMRGMELIDDEPTSVTIRDPFFVTWEITIHSLPTFLA